ncbi:MAG: dTMP kinase [Gammaproteobacteria bacterium]
MSHEDKHSRGRFITLEGIEGAGKSTVIAEIEQQLHKRDIQTLCTREPGGTGIAEAIRELVLAPREHEVLHPRAELLLVFAAREQHLVEVIRPALEAGNWVICDRFTDASFAYQGAGRGIETERIEALGEWIHGDLWPDLTLLLDVDVEVGLARAKKRSEPDRFEREKNAFFDRARACYNARAQANPARFRRIDASATLPAVRAATRDAISEFCAEIAR